MTRFCAIYGAMILMGKPELWMYMCGCGRVLGDTGRLIETVRGVGYRMADKGADQGMKRKSFSHTGFMIVLTAILTFIAASFLMYEKFDDVMKRLSEMKRNT